MLADNQDEAVIVWSAALDPVPLGSPILGFRSKAAMLGFRVKNLMQPLPAAAGQEAARLFQNAG